MGRLRDWAINRRPTVIEDYGPDPRGTAMFEALSGMLQNGISGHTGHVYTGDRGSAEKSFNGDLGHDLQHFTGEAALSLYGAARPTSPLAAQLGDGPSLTDALSDPGLRIFAARAARRARQ